VNQAHSFGVLLATADGGKTWTRLKQPPAANSMLFRSPKDGWLAEDGDLYRTGDGGNTWQQISLKAPPGMKSARVADDYNLPVFQDATHGSMLAGYVALDSSGFALDGSGITVLFSTTDGGNTWSVRQVLPSGFGGQKVAVTGDTVLAAEISRSYQLTVTKAGALNSRVQTDLTSLVNGDLVVGFSVLNDDSSWLLAMRDASKCFTFTQLKCTELLSTSDGGVSWTKISPPKVKW
jgi:hypothetical protein